jgi:hypothetical protein
MKTIVEPDGSVYLLVTRVLDDAQHLNRPCVRTGHSRRRTEIDEILQVW